MPYHPGESIETSELIKSINIQECGLALTIENKGYGVYIINSTKGGAKRRPYKLLDKCTKNELVERAQARKIKVTGLTKQQIIEKLRCRKKKA